MKKTIALPEGFLVDMDGVLLISTQSSDQSWSDTCQHFAPGLGLPQQQLEEALCASLRAYQSDIAHSPQKQRRDRLQPFETRREVVARALEEAHVGENSVAEEMVRMYEALREEHRQMTPSAQKTLQTLRDQGFPLALISNGNATYQREKIRRHQLAPLFDVILIEEEFGAAKPDPAIFLAALAQLRIPAQRAWMVGDDLALDIAGSQRLGITAIWCDFDRQGLPPGQSVHPDRIIDAFPQILDLLEEGQRSR